MGTGKVALDKPRHVKYWTRCLKTLLPHQYTSNDSNRMYLAYFILAALDLLDVVDTASTQTERDAYIDWIYHCQHPQGGFRMWPGTDFGDRGNPSNATWDPANLPATYFALASLLILKDDFSRVRRKATLRWIHKMQRPDGSFGETFVQGKIQGGRDPRYAYCATGVRYILRGPLPDGPLPASTSDPEHQQAIPDIDISNLVASISAAQSHDGGLADEAFHEPHAGYTFCSLGALAFLNRLNHLSDATTPPQAKGSLDDTSYQTAPEDPFSLLHWLTSLQTTHIDPDNPYEDGNSEDEETPHQHLPATEDSSASFPSLSSSTAAGLSGRPNKPSDTCYAFWVCASLQILFPPSSSSLASSSLASSSSPPLSLQSASNLFDKEKLLRYLLCKVQHPVLGGFGKFPGDLPDLYHSYLGLAAVSLVRGGGGGGASGEDEKEKIKELDPGMCLSKEARGRLEGLWRQWAKH